MNDTIIFMSAYKGISNFKTKKFSNHNVNALLKNHHISYLMFENKLLTRKGALYLNREYDYIHQRTKFTYIPMNENVDSIEYKEIINKTRACVNLLQAESVLSDSVYFNIDYFIYMDSFIVYINNRVFQIDPIIYSLNTTLIIAFEIIDYETGIPLKNDDILGGVHVRSGDYNLLKVKGFRFFDEDFTTLADCKIPELIYNNINTFLSAIVGSSSKECSFIHNILVLTNKISDVEKYLCSLKNVRELPTPLENISTTHNYQYYPQDGASVVTGYIEDDVDTILYNAIFLESYKIYIYLLQIVNIDVVKSMNEVIHNDLYLETLFCAPHVPIETFNLLGYIYKTKSFQHHKEVTKLKISYLTMDNETRKTRNAVLLNILLYIISLLGAIGTLEILENKFSIPFEISFFVVIFLFSLLGIIWLFNERQNKN